MPKKECMADRINMPYSGIHASLVELEVKDRPSIVFFLSLRQADVKAAYKAFLGATECNIALWALVVINGDSKDTNYQIY